MKVEIRYTVDVDDDFRRAINHQFNHEEGLATRADVRDWFIQHGESASDLILSDYYGTIEARKLNTCPSCGHYFPTSGYIYACDHCAQCCNCEE